MKQPTPVTFEHAQLRQLAVRLARLHADDPEIIAHATALSQIGSGADANVVLGVKRRRGQNTKKEEAHYKTRLAISWIAGRMNLVGKTPPTKISAIREAAIAFDLDEDHLTRSCPPIEDLAQLKEFEWDSLRPHLQNSTD